MTEVIEAAKMTSSMLMLTFECRPTFNGRQSASTPDSSNKRRLSKENHYVDLYLSDVKVRNYDEVNQKWI